MGEGRCDDVGGIGKGRKLLRCLVTESSGELDTDDILKGSTGLCGLKGVGATSSSFASDAVFVVSSGTNDSGSKVNT